jgi:hypothetical protein
VNLRCESLVAILDDGIPTDVRVETYKMNRYRIASSPFHRTVVDGAKIAQDGAVGNNASSGEGIVTFISSMNLSISPYYTGIAELSEI